jgi:hypothetical protein
MASSAIALPPIAINIIARIAAIRAIQFKDFIGILLISEPGVTIGT